MAKKKKKTSKLLLVILLLVVIAGGSAIGFINSSNGPLDKNDSTEISVEIPQGSGTAAIGSILEENGVIKSAFSFRLRSKIFHFDGMYKKGNYTFSPSMTTDEIMELLMKGTSYESVRITIPEGSTLTDIAAIVEASGICTADEFLSEAENGSFDYAFLKDAIKGEKRLEGYLFPDTYDIYVNEVPHNIIDKLLSQFDTVYGELLAQSDGTIASKYSTSEIITMASMIETEAKLDSERPLVASVIYNRLAKGMRLQLDCTVQYALGTPKERLLYKDLEVDSPYNTYKVDGLPAGPIASPGRASIEAVLNPASTDYIYYVASASGDGSHNFAVTADEFEKYKKEYKSSLS